MPYSNKYLPGNQLVTCDICGFDYRFSSIKKGIMGTQIGLNICPKDFDEIHPREKVRSLRPQRRVTTGVLTGGVNRVPTPLIKDGAWIASGLRLASGTTQAGGN